MAFGMRNGRRESDGECQKGEMTDGISGHVGLFSDRSFALGFWCVDGLGRKLVQTSMDLVQVRATGPKPGRAYGVCQVNICQ